MDITLKAIEEMKLSKTEVKIMECLFSNVTNEISIASISNEIMVLHATTCKELKKLVTKGIIIIDGSIISLSDFGKKARNYNNFRIQILTDFCKKNNLDNETYKEFIKDRSYCNIKLLLGIKNLLNK